MAATRRFGPADLLLLALVVVVAGGVRAGYLIRYADGGRTDGPLRVQEAEPPLPVVEERTAHVSPGYPWLVGTLGRFIAADRLDSTVRWLQMALGTLTAGFYFLFARRAFRSLLVATLAGLFAACHPFWIIATA